MRMRVSVVFVGVVLTMASVIALDAQGKGKPAPPVAVGAALQGGHLLEGDGGPYSGGDGVISQIFADSGDWVLDLRDQTLRAVHLTFNPVGLPGPLTGSGSYNARVLSRCFDPQDNITGFLEIGEGESNALCSLRVMFTSSGKQYALVMSPLQGGTGTATVSCAETDGDGTCEHWTIVPTSGPLTVANLYEIGKAGRETFKGAYYNTFAIDVMRAQ
jgi:hypothetical protein